MADSPIIDYFFMEGRKARSGRRGPGILIVDGKYKFRMNTVNKAGDKYKMYCVKQAHPEYSCKAKVEVLRTETGSFHPYSSVTAIEHTHSPDPALVKAEVLKQRMINIVEENPNNPLAQAIKTVKLEFAKENGESSFYHDVIGYLGNKHALESMLSSKRCSIYGPIPKKRKKTVISDESIFNGDNAECSSEENKTVNCSLEENAHIKNTNSSRTHDQSNQCPITNNRQELVFLCQECSFTTKFKYNLKRHIDLLHNRAVELSKDDHQHLSKSERDDFQRHIDLINNRREKELLPETEGQYA